MDLFYYPNIYSGNILLDEQESKHIIRVLRLSAGDRIHITDGKGNLFETRIIEDHPKKCKVEIISVKKKFQKRDFKVHLAVAPTKNIARFEWFLEKATEIGIDEITPIICDHSERRILKTARLNRVIIGAMKQSLKAYLPVLHEPTGFDEFLKGDFPDQKFIAYFLEDNPELKETYIPGSDAIVLVGPEGDFSAGEIDRAVDSGFITVNLGKSRLRTETAALVICPTINHLKY